MSLLNSNTDSHSERTRTVLAVDAAPFAVVSLLLLLRSAKKRCRPVGAFLLHWLSKRAPVNTDEMSSKCKTTVILAVLGFQGEQPMLIDFGSLVDFVSHLGWGNIQEY